MFYAKKKIQLLFESVIFKSKFLVLADVLPLWDPKYFGFGKHAEKVSWWKERQTGGMKTQSHTAWSETFSICALHKSF